MSMTRTTLFKSNRSQAVRLPKGVAFPVPLKKGVNGSLLCYVSAPDGVSIELMQC